MLLTQTEVALHSYAVEMVSITPGLWAETTVPNNIQSCILNMKGVHGFGPTNSN